MVWSSIPLDNDISLKLRISSFRIWPLLKIHIWRLFGGLVVQGHILKTYPPSRGVCYSTPAYAAAFKSVMLTWRELISCTAQFNIILPWRVPDDYIYKYMYVCNVSAPHISLTRLQAESQDRLCSYITQGCCMDLDVGKFAQGQRWKVTDVWL